ncbi:uncharacterized protein METZ01_LOCUS94794, partial [marine metagenome]
MLTERSIPMPFLTWGSHRIGFDQDCYPSSKIP